MVLTALVIVVVYWLIRLAFGLITFLVCKILRTKPSELIKRVNDFSAMLISVTIPFILSDSLPIWLFCLLLGMPAYRLLRHIQRSPIGRKRSTFQKKATRNSQFQQSSNHDRWTAEPTVNQHSRKMSSMDSATTAAFTGAAGATFFSSSSDHLFDDFNMHSTPTSSSDIDPIDHSTTFAGYDPMDLDMSRAMAGDPTSPYYDFFHTDHTSGSGGFDDGIGGSSFDDSFGSSSINDPFSNDI